MCDVRSLKNYNIHTYQVTLLSSNRQVLAKLNVMRLATDEEFDGSVHGTSGNAHVDAIGACLIDMTIILFNDMVEVVKRRHVSQIASHLHLQNKRPYKHVHCAEVRTIEVVDVADAPGWY